jgi:hypothetical protein
MDKMKRSSTTRVGLEERYFVSYFFS